MSLADVVARVRSGVVHIEYRIGAERVGSGTGFMARQHLVTNNHVFLGPPNANVTLAWQPDADPASRREVALPYAEFQRALVTGSPENALDFAILDVPQLRAVRLYDFTLKPPAGYRVGDPIALLGFPLEHRNLTCHAGIMSSFYASGRASVIQVDASVNQSNSGGPLLDPATGEVLGIVTRKGTGLSRMFDQLLATFDQNLAALQQARGIIAIGSVDPVAALIASQHQLRFLAAEILRSANVGIGYAFSVEHVLAEQPFANRNDETPKDHWPQASGA
jgi:hypothetical protein